MDFQATALPFDQQNFKPGVKGPWGLGAADRQRVAKRQSDNIKYIVIFILIAVLVRKLLKRA